MRYDSDKCAEVRRLERGLSGPPSRAAIQAPRITLHCGGTPDASRSGHPFMITFNCPNGHSLSCPEDRAGQSAMCPRCGVRITVPSAGQREREQNSVATVAARSDSDSSPSSNAAGTDDGLIVFLCPNGHKLNGPATLQGRPGQCPHCKARFIIPNYNDVEEIDEFASDVEHLEEIAEPELEQDEEPAPEPVTHVPPPVGDLSLLATYVDWLWERRDANCVLELFLEDGNILRPELYSPELSDREFGVFCVQDDIGTYTMNIVRWSKVARLLMRNMRDIPHSYFH